MSAVYVCLDDDVRSLSAGLVLRRRATDRTLPIIVQVSSEPASAAGLLRRATGHEGVGGVHLFGLIEQTCTPELLGDNTTETIAQALHEQYVRDQTRAGFDVSTKPNLRPWRELAEAVRDDNRAQARHVGVKLASVGCDVRVLDDWGESAVELTGPEVDLLARMEHDRWMKARVDRGWTLGPRDDAARRHPDMVPWEELSEQSRDIDRGFVRALPELLARASFQLVRRRASPGQ